MHDLRSWRRPRAIAIGAVLLLHLALIGGLRQAWHRAETHHEHQAHQAQPRSSIRMVTITLPPLASLASQAPRPAARTPAQPAALSSVKTSARPRPAREAKPDPAPEAQAHAPETASPREDTRSTLVVAAPAAWPASAASGPSGRDLLHGAATQRAVRQSTQGQPLLAERMDQANQAPEKIEASAKLGKEMMKGATGDCLKGEYAGGGAGLLSLPFWLLAEARGKCRR